MDNVLYRLATGGDLPAIQALVTHCGLRTDGLECLTDHCLVAISDSQLAGTIALEPCGRLGLLRSLAVAPDWRNQSIGRTLCRKMIHHAHLAGVEELYLLTMDAERYFAALGFQRIERDKAPAPIQATTQFRTSCPKSAICMAREITGEVIHASADLLRLRPDVPGAQMWAVSLQQTMLTYFEVAPRSRFGPHSHASEQITMVLSGELYFEVDSEVHCIKAGEVMAIPSSVPHAVWTEGSPVTAVDAWSPVMRKYEPIKG